MSLTRFTCRLAGPTAALLLAAALALSAARPASANGVPTRIPLAYLPNLSSWGPVDAHGEAELSFAEALIRIDVKGLPALTDEQYQAWLVKSGTNKAIAVGTFNSGAGAIAGYTGKLENLDGYDYDLIMITVEPVQDSDPGPSARRSVGGFFQPVKRQDTAASLNSDTEPAQLPKTGEAPSAEQSGGNRIGLLMIGGGIAIYVITMRRVRSRR